MKYAVIIADYKSLERTQRYVDDFIAACDDIDDVEFVVVDNDDSYSGRTALENWAQEKTEAYKGWHGREVPVHLAHRNDKTIHCLYPKANLGYANANNLGALYARDCLQAEYLIFSNNDLLFPENFRLSLYERIYREDTCRWVIGPAVFGLDGKQQSPGYEYSSFEILFGRYWWILSGRMLPFFKSRAVPSPKSGPQGFLVGAFLVCHGDEFFQVGGFDEQTFLYYEEDILRAKGIRQGWQFYYTDEMRIQHEGGATTDDHIGSLKKEKLMFESGCYFLHKYKSVPEIIIFLAKINLHAFYCPLYRLLKPVKDWWGRKRN